MGTLSRSEQILRLQSDICAFGTGIDAISVNQTDNDERNSQVLLMRDIYTHCERCIAWLGEEDNNTKDALSFLKFFAQDTHLHDWDGFSDVLRNVDQLTAEIWDKFFEERPQVFKPMLDGWA